MIPMPLKEVALAVGVVPSPGWERIEVRRVTTDSREVGAGDLFLPIRGARFDGHGFVDQAVAKGAVACICAHDWVKRTNEGSLVPRLPVDDTVDALGRLAAYYRRKVMPISTAVIAVTGSNGKTTTKGMIHHVLGTALKGRCAPKSFNNNIGVPLTLLSGDADDRYLVVEIGTNAPGEVGALAEVAAPDVAVITSIGEAHLEGLGDVRAIAAEKASLLAHVHPEGFAVVNVDRLEILPHLYSDLPSRLWTFGFEPIARLRVTDVRGTIRGTRFQLEDRYEVALPFPGPHHATNAVAAFAVARWFGIDPREIIEDLATFAPPEGRTRLVEVAGVTVVDDSYNANPSSMAAAIEALCLVEDSRRVLVMGDMLELGTRSAALHRQMVQQAIDSGVDVLVAVGKATVSAVSALELSLTGPRVCCCSDADAAGTVISELLAPGDTVWVKASRAMGLDRVLGYIEEAHAAAVPDEAAPESGGLCVVAAPVGRREAG